jgi:hypothetical protein
MEACKRWICRGLLALLGGEPSFVMVFSTFWT